MTKGRNEGFIGKIEDGLMKLGIQSNISFTGTIGVAVAAAATAIGAATQMRSQFLFQEEHHSTHNLRSLISS